MPDGDRLVAGNGKTVDGAEPQPTLRPIDCALSLACVSQHNAAKEEREGRRWAECKRPLERFTGCNVVMP